MNSFSVVIPVYNSTDSLSLLCDQLTKVLAGDDFEIILVDDGSQDATWEQINAIKSRLGNKVTGIRLSKNFGQHNATICGLNYATKEYVVTIDDDLQFSPEDIPALLMKLNSDLLDIVYGIPVVKRQSFLRRAGFYIMSLIGLFFREKLKKASSFRLMKKDLADQLKTKKEYYVRIDEIIKWYTVRVGYYQVEHYVRKLHRSGYSTTGLIGMVARSVIAYSAVPYKLFMFSFVVSALLNILIFSYYIFFGSIFHGLVPLAIMIFIMLFALAFATLFAYLYHITSYTSKKPCYHITEQI